jgi:hypothetical protein
MMEAVIDTYERPLAPVAAEPDALAEFRQQAKLELAEKSERNKFSDAALLKLRLIREQDKVQDAMDARMTAALKSVIVTPENLSKLLTRCNTSIPVKQLERRVAKLNFWIIAGYRLGHEIDSVTMLNFFSELTNDERKMSDSKFAKTWDMESAEKIKASRLRRGLIESDVATPKAAKQPYWNPARCRKNGLCKAGSLCLKVSNTGKPAPTAEGKQYCGTACQGCYPIRLQKQQIQALSAGNLL